MKVSVIQNSKTHLHRSIGVLMSEVSIQLTQNYYLLMTVLVIRLRLGALFYIPSFWIPFVPPRSLFCSSRLLILKLIWSSISLFNCKMLLSFAPRQKGTIQSLMTWKHKSEQRRDRRKDEGALRENMMWQKRNPSSQRRC